MSMSKIKISDEKILAAIAPLLKVAEEHNSALAQVRERCDALYNRDKLGNELEGFSQYVAATVFDTIEWLKPSMVDIFTHPDFFSISMDDTDKAERNKKLLRYQLFRLQRGSKVIRGYVDTALKYHNGVLKVFYDEEYESESEEFDRLSIEQYQQLEQDDSVVISKADEIEEYGYGNDVTIWYENVKIVREVEKYRGPKAIVVPPEEFLYTPDGATVDECSLVGTRQKKTVGDILAGERRGLYRKGSAKAVYDGGGEQAFEDEEEKIRRSETAETINIEVGSATYGDEQAPNKPVYVYELCLRLDIDGDGIAEKIIVWKCGDQVLNVIVNPYGRPPYRTGCLYEKTFRLEGDPLPIKLEADQKETTNLRRIYVDSAADSAYGTMVSNDNHFLDDWTFRRPGDAILKTSSAQHEFIRGDQPGESLLKGLDLVRSDFERTSGVNSLNQGLTPKSMGKTAAGTIALQNAGQQRQKLYATILGEPLRDVIKDFMWINKTWKPKDAINILGREVIQVAPDDLDGDADVTIEVGVSPNDRLEKIQQLESHFQKLIQAIIPAGGAGIEHLLKTERKIGKLSGFSMDDLQYSDDEVNSFKQLNQQVQQLQQQLQQLQQPMQGQIPHQVIGGHNGGY